MQATIGYSDEQHQQFMDDGFYRLGVVVRLH